MPEREPGREVAGVVPAVAHEHALAVADLAVLAGEVAERRVVLEAHGERRRQAARRVRRRRPGRRPARSPSPGRRTTPAGRRGASSAHGIVTGAPVLTTTTVFGLAADDPRDQLVLARRAGPSCRGRGPSVSQSSLVPTTTTTASASRGRGDGAARAGRRATAGATRASRPAGTSRPRARRTRRRARPARRRPARPSPRPRRCRSRRTRAPGGGGSATPSSTTVAVDQHTAPAADLTSVNVCAPGLVRRVPAGGAEREVVGVDPGRRRADQQQPAVGGTRGRDRRAREVASGEELDGEPGVPSAVVRAPSGGSTVDVAARARSGRRRRRRSAARIASSGLMR